MQRFDLGHLEVLRILLETQSVSKASKLLHVTPSAVSRSLAKIRSSLGDQILIPAGRDLVLTKRGEELRMTLKRSVDELHAILSPSKVFDPATMKREFHVRASYYLGGFIVESVTQQMIKHAPLSRLVLHPEGDESQEPLRDGSIDLDIGTLGLMGPEFMSQSLFKDKYVSVFSTALFKKTKLSMSDFCKSPHLIVSRKGKTSTIVDDVLKTSGRNRKIMATLAGYHEAFETAARVKCIVVAPQTLFERSGHWYRLSSCRLPVTTPILEIAQTWHPRHQADPEHRWLREQIKASFKI